MAARVLGRGVTRAGMRVRALTTICLLALLAGVIPAAPAWSKVPGAVHCYRKVCHRVKTLAETERLVGQTLFLRTSYYDDPKVDRFNVGVLTSSGERFDARNAARAASSIFPDGTELLIWNPRNGRAAHVRVNDFGPFHSNRTLDITRGLAERLGLIRSGVADLSVTVIAAPPAREPRYRAFRTYPQTKGYLGSYSEADVTAVVAELVQEARSLSPPLPERAPRLAAVVLPQPKPWHRPARGSVPSTQVALETEAPSQSVRAFEAVPQERAQRVASGALDLIVAADVPDSAMFDPPTPVAVGSGNVDRLRFAAVILSAPTPASATLLPGEADPSANRGPATAFSYLLAGGMLSLIVILIAVATRPLRLPAPAPTIVAATVGAEPTAHLPRAVTVTVIDAGLSVEGDLTSSGDVVLKGRLTGNCRCRRLHVGKSGHLIGDVVADELVIEGTIVGNIFAHSVRADGRAALDGEVSYTELAVARDAQVNAVCRLRPRRAPFPFDGNGLRRAA